MLLESLVSANVCYSPTHKERYTLEARGVAPCLSQGFGGDAMDLGASLSSPVGVALLGGCKLLACDDAGQGLPGGDENGLSVLWSLG